MTKTEHLQFLVLMIPTFVILAAAVVSMADLSMPSTQHSYTVALANPMADAVWDDRTAE
jgi:hypothetical protein